MKKYDIYVVVWAYGDVIAAYETLDEAQKLVERRLGKMPKWEHHDSHGDVWLAATTRYTIQKTPLG